MSMLLQPVHHVVRHTEVFPRSKSAEAVAILRLLDAMIPSRLTANFRGIDPHLVKSFVQKF
jgi:hypothetical protein